MKPIKKPNPAPQRQLLCPPLTIDEAELARRLDQAAADLAGPIDFAVFTPEVLTKLRVQIENWTWPVPADPRR